MTLKNASIEQLWQWHAAIVDEIQQRTNVAQATAKAPWEEAQGVNDPRVARRDRLVTSPATHDGDQYAKMAEEIRQQRTRNIELQRQLHDQRQPVRVDPPYAPPHSEDEVDRLLARTTTRLAKREPPTFDADRIPSACNICGRTYCDHPYDEPAAPPPLRRDPNAIDEAHVSAMTKAAELEMRIGRGEDVGDAWPRHIPKPDAAYARAFHSAPKVPSNGKDVTMVNTQTGLPVRNGSG